MRTPKKTDKVFHTLKTDKEYFEATRREEKFFEIRNNDRNFKVGDIVYLKENKKDGRILPPMEITYIFHGGKFGLAEGYCVFQLRVKWD